MTISKSPEKFNLEDLINKFNDPLKSCSAHEVESPQEAKEEFEKLNKNFQLKSDTKIQEQALRHILELLKGKIQFYPGGDLKSFAKFIERDLLDMRPALVRMASLVVAAEALVLEDDFIPSVDIIFPALLKQLSSNNQSIVHSCHLALLNIAKHCMNRKVAKLFLSNSTSSIPANRQIAAECAHIITETWPSQLASLLSKELNTTVSSLLQDSVETIRDIAVSATKINRSSDPSTKSSKLTSTLPYISTPMKSIPKPKTPNKQKSEPPATTPKSSLKSPKETPSIRQSPKPRSESPSTNPKKAQKRSNSPTQKNTDSVSDFMHPSNASQARSFKYHLEEIIESKNYSALYPFKGTLVGSVLFSIKEIPNFNEWEFVMESLFDNYEELFSSHMLEIMAQFGFQDDIVDFANKKVGIQNLAEAIAAEGKPRLPDSFNFFVAVFKSNKHQIDITKTISTLLQNLVKQNPHNKNVEYIEKVVKSEPDRDMRTNLEEIMFDLSNNNGDYNKWGDKLDNLYENFFKPNSNQYLRNSSEPAKTDQVNEKETDISSSSINLSIAKMEITPSSKLTTNFFSQNLPVLIKQGTDDQRMACLNFITAASPKLRSVSFKTSLKPIIDSLINAESSLSMSSLDDENKPTCTWHKNAIQCIALMLTDIDTLSESLILVSQQNQQMTEIILESLYHFTALAIPQKIFAVHKVLVKKLGMFLNNDNPIIRHNTVSIFAECRKKIPKEFLYQMKRNFTPAQIRLIELKAGRYKKK